MMVQSNHVKRNRTNQKTAYPIYSKTLSTNRSSSYWCSPSLDRGPKSTQQKEKIPLVKKSLFFVIVIFFGVFSLLVFSKKRINTGIKDFKQNIPKIIDTIAPQPTKILETGLPDQHLIKTSFVPQSPEKNWDQPWQDACEEAAILTVDYFYKNQSPSLKQIKKDILAMMDFETKEGWTRDVNLSQMATISAKYLGYRTEIIDNPTVDTIKNYLVQDIPIVIPANGKILFKENSHFRSGGPYYHNLVILGYNDQRQQFTVHDVGTQFGAYYRYSYTTLMDSIHDFPNSGHKEDISLGSKKALILIK